MENTEVLTEVILSQPILLFLKIIISITVGLILKELCIKIALGVIFYFDRNFNEGDIVYLDGEEAIIIKIGLFTTVFMIKNGRGTVWKYVSNDRIKYSNLEKIIKPKEKGDEDK